jgi:HK97 family phage major capsid protein
MDDAKAKANLIIDRVTAEGRGIRSDEQAEFDRLIAVRSAAEAWCGQSRGRKAGWPVDAAVSDSASADMALRAWACGTRASSSMREAAERYGIDIQNPELDLRALSVGTATAGGSAVQNEANRAFDLAEKWFGPMRQLATVYQTTTGAPLPVPTVDDTANTAEIVAEGSAITTTADPLFGSVTLDPHKYVSRAVIVSMELLQDAAIPLADVLGGELGKRIGRKQNTDFTAGAGTTLPFGVQVQASLGKTAAATNAITFDEVLDLQAAVDTAYATRPGAGFMVHPSTANYLRKIKDSQNRYLWEMSVQGPSPAQGNIRGEAGRIAGFPVYLNADMDSAFSTNKRLVLFGDFRSYWIQDAGPPILVRADELRLLTGESVFVAFRRSDGALVNTAAVKYLRTA